MTDRVWVLDSSALFAIKTDVAADAQWAALERMKVAVQHGRIAVARQVVAEARQVRHHDGPEIWLLDVQHHLRHPRDCSLTRHAEVMQGVGRQLIDPDAEGEHADPYVLALALDLIDAGHDAVVVTHDRIDRAGRLSLVSACDAMSVPTADLDAFLSALP